MTDSVTTESTTTSPPEPGTTEDATATTRGPPDSVLLFHRTEGFRHDSIPAGVAAVEDLGAASGYTVTATEDPSLFSPDRLRSFDVVVFLNTTGDVLDGEQQAAFEGFMAAGKGFVGIHSAADTEYDWSWYGHLVGAYFNGHPEPQEATVVFADPADHPVSEGMPEQVDRFDEWYDFRTDPPSGATILATVDESSYQGGSMGDPHPIAWAQEIHGGRSVYIGFGHTSESFDDPLVRTLIDNAISWVGRRGS